MSIGIPSASTAVSTDRSASEPHPAASFEERWAAWQARGAAHDRAVRRKMTIAAPIAVVIAAALAVLFAR